MGVGFKRFLSVCVGLTSVAMTLPAIAQEEPAPAEAPTAEPMMMIPENIPDAIERTVQQESGDVFSNRSVQRQGNLILGFGESTYNSFPENEILTDSRNLHLLYRELLYQQVSSTQPIRVPDLPSPYNTSILQSPSVDLNRMAARSLPVGREYLFETLPPR